MTDIEQDYVEQGYTLPAGWTWAHVAECRAKYSIDEIRVPVAVGPQVVAWGVPMIDGEYLSHP